MAKKLMSEATKAKIAATRAANKAAGGEGTVKASLEDKIAAAQAAADAGDPTAQSLMPLLDVQREAISQAIADKKAAAKRIRKLLSVLA